jgi:hypothetical protein
MIMQKRQIWITTDFISRRGFIVLSPLNKTSYNVHSLGASSDPKVETLITAPLDMVSPMFFVRPAAV